MAVLMLQYLTGGAWGIAIRRPLEAPTRTLPLMRAFFVPVALRDAPALRVDARRRRRARRAPAEEDALPERALLPGAHGRPSRVWIRCRVLPNRWSRRAGRPADLGRSTATCRSSRGRGPRRSTRSRSRYLRRLGHVARAPLVLDDVRRHLHGEPGARRRSRSRRWRSSRLSALEPSRGFLGGRHLHDLGKMMFAFTMIWAYVNFSQYLIVWSGNIPEEIPWYLAPLPRRLGVGRARDSALPLRRALPAAALARGQPQPAAPGAARRGCSSSCASWTRPGSCCPPSPWASSASTGWTWPCRSGSAVLWLAFYAQNLASRPLLPGATTPVSRRRRAWTRIAASPAPAAAPARMSMASRPSRTSSLEGASSSSSRCSPS